MEKFLVATSLSCLVFVDSWSSMESASFGRFKRQSEMYPSGNVIRQGDRDSTYPTVVPNRNDPPNGNVIRQGYQDSSYPSAVPDGQVIRQGEHETGATDPNAGLIRTLIDWMKTLLRTMGWKPSWDPSIWKDSAGRLMNTAVQVAPFIL
ncbi:hypothetical protein RvY_16170 [Ramazzottius varieornatus]|uniref:Uncharacterized protein n=1 Tax=Ramazzottius varieornatus TaxID=947166 RepID=A0A1D1W591_RAMVA|nr:hypothetical protein RvY_16170 [Ramazzottius varieornatus]